MDPAAPQRQLLLRQRPQLDQMAQARARYPGQVETPDLTVNLFQEVFQQNLHQDR